VDPASPQEEFVELREKIFRDTGIDCSRYKENYLKRRIAARMRAVGMGTYAEYSGYLDRVADEYPRLKDRITVNVTEFFRDQDVYSYLRSTLLPPLAEKCRQENRPLLVWSAGCSSGEEPYSLAILLSELGGCEFSVLATDIDDACLARAREGRYLAEALEKADIGQGSRWFKRDADEAVVVDAIKQRVRFERHNLFADPPPSSMDLVLCRNVMIYFSRELQQRLLESFHAALREGGYMLPGKTETILGQARQLYNCVSARERAFQRL
jgi:chemotaxis protein methyltransferase CheR